MPAREALLRPPVPEADDGNLEAWFGRVADGLLNGSRLLAGGGDHRFVEAEVYYHSQAHPDRFIPFCALDPRANTGRPERFGRIDLPGLIELLKRYKDQGVRGFGEHQVGLPLNHPLMMTVYEACARVGLPILFHLDDIRGIDTPGLPRLENVLKSFPSLPLIGHAAGFWASISGDVTAPDLAGYPKGPVKSGGALDRLFDGYPNLWGDLSAGSGAGALSRDREFGRQLLSPLTIVVEQRPKKARDGVAMRDEFEPIRRCTVKRQAIEQRAPAMIGLGNVAG